MLNSNTNKYLDVTRNLARYIRRENNEQFTVRDFYRQALEVLDGLIGFQFEDPRDQVYTQEELQHAERVLTKLVALIALAESSEE